jgi:hypothetical protein
MRRAVRLALLTVASSVVAPLVHAADEGAERDAQARFEEGLARAKGGDFDAARISFTQAYAVLRRPRILWNLALSEEKTGHVLEALAHFKSVARDSSADEADRAGAQTHVASLYGETAHIEVRAPAGAPVTIDSGPVVGTTPLADVLDVAAGRHVVEAHLPQGTSAIVVQPAAGEVVAANFLAPAASIAPATPLAGAPGPAAVPAAPRASTHAAPSIPADTGGSTEAPRVIVVAAVGGVAVAALVFGVYFGATSSSDANTAKGLRAQLHSDGCNAPMGAAIAMCSQLNDAVSSENRNAGLSTGMYVTAGALAAAGLVTWLVWPKIEPAHRAIRVSPMVGPGVVAGLSGGTAF